LSEGDLLVVSDRSRADGRYLIVASEGTDFVVKTPKGLARTGTQIVTTKVAMEIGEEDTTSAPATIDVSPDRRQAATELRRFLRTLRQAVMAGVD
jgi:hypothetical protein